MHKTYGILPGSIVFHRDMLLPIPIIANLQFLRDKQQAVIDKNNLQDSRRRRTQILILVSDPKALSTRTTGPYIITQAHANGTISFLRNNEVFERINIRRIKPYYT